MLNKYEFAESQTPIVNLHEDTGISGQAMGAVFKALYLNHQSTLWRLEEELKRKTSKYGMVYKITPLHLLELLWFTYPDSQEDEYYESPSRRCAGIEPEKLRWWLNSCSDETGDAVRTMRPFPLYAIKPEQVASVARRIAEMFPGYGPSDEREDYIFKRKALSSMVVTEFIKLEAELIDSNQPREALDERQDNKILTENMAQPKCNDLFITRDLLVEYIRKHMDTIRWHKPIRWHKESHLVPQLKDHIIRSSKYNRGYEGQKHPNPRTYFFLHFEDIEYILMEPSIARSMIITAQGLTYFLWLCKYLHEYSKPPLPRDDKDTHAWAYDIPIEELPRILLAVDKYDIPPTMMRQWISMWFDFKCPKFERRKLQEQPQGLRTLLLATHKFDHAEGFHKVTCSLDIRKTTSIQPSLSQLVARFPALKNVVTLDSRILICLKNRAKYSSSGLCLDCFNASLYPIEDASMASEDMKDWAETNFQTFGWTKTLLEEFYSDDFHCRVRHNKIVWERCWVGARPKWKWGEAFMEILSV